MSAAREITDMFVVHSVAMVSSVDRVKRDANRTRDFSPRGRQSVLFSQILEEKEQELQRTPLECHTITYGQDSRLRTFLYRSREYGY